MSDVSAFIASMPADYRIAFSDDGAAMAEHAAIIAQRGDRPAHTATWSGNRDGATALCIVAEDQPGLFARITSALVAHAIDILSAQAYCRERGDGTVEAVDFLWIRRDRPLEDRDIAAITDLIDGLARGATNIDRIDDSLRPPRRRAKGITRVRFDHDAASGATVLTVEAGDRAGLLLQLTKTIFVARLQIVGLHAKSERGRAIDRFTLAELDGSSVTLERRLELQVRILEAIDASYVTSRSADSETSSKPDSARRRRSSRAMT
jgi:UTP:GlnB (protein PII) uridylyltransferase